MNIGVNALLCFRWDSPLKNLIPQALTLKKIIYFGDGGGAKGPGNNGAAGF